MGDSSGSGPKDVGASDGPTGTDDTGSDDEEPGDAMSTRIPGSRLKTWVLLDANRHLVTATLLALLFVAFVVLGALDPVGIRSTMVSKDPIETAFQGLLTAIITGVTLVVTINQLVLSQELGAVGDQRERMEGAMAFRDDVEDALGLTVAPADPSAFLRAIVDAAGDRAEALTTTATGPTGAERRARIEDYADGVREIAGSASEQLSGARFGTFEVVSAALDFDYSSMIHEGRRLQSEDDVGGDDEIEAAIADVVEALEFFGPAREHVKTLYFQWELIDLSRSVLYAAIPSLVVVTGMILYLDDPSSLPGATLGVDNLVWVVSGAVTIALVPFVLLFAYILRIATVTKRTLAIGPFLLRDTDNRREARERNEGRDGR